MKFNFFSLWSLLAANAFMSTLALSQRQIDSFVKCVNEKSNEKYGFTVDQNSLIIHNIVNGNIDFNGRDKALFECLRENLLGASVEVQSRNDDNEGPEGLRPIAGMNVQNTALVSDLKPIAKSRTGSKAKSEQTSDYTVGSTAFNLSTIAPRQCIPYTYWTYDSHDAQCWSENASPNQPNACHGWNSARASISFENSYPVSMVGAVWPHHRCEKGDQAYVLVAPYTTSACKVRTTYSYDATFGC